MPKRRVHRIYSKKSASRRAFAYAILIVVGVLTVTILLDSLWQKNNVLGTQSLLAKGDDGDDNSGSGSSGSDSSGSGGSSSGSSNSGSNDSDDDEPESSTTTSNTGSSGSSGSSGRGSLFNIFPQRSTIPQPTTVDDEDEDELDEQNEVEDEDDEDELTDEPIEVITKDDRTRINITANGIKVRLERRADRVIIKAEREDGTEVELEDNALFKIDDRLAKSNIKVETAGDNEFLVIRNTTGALTNFPISLDLATNALIINTPSGQKTVAILPDTAVQNLLAANIIDRLGSQAFQSEGTENTLPAVDRLITLGEQGGVPVYEINGIDNQRLFGLIPVAVDKDVTVSAETGDVVSTQESFINRVLDLLSF